MLEEVIDVALDARLARRCLNARLRPDLPIIACVSMNSKLKAARQDFKAIIKS